MAYFRSMKSVSVLKIAPPCSTLKLPVSRYIVNEVPSISIIELAVEVTDEAMNPTAFGPE